MTENIQTICNIAEQYGFKCTSTGKSGAKIHYVRYENIECDFILNLEGVPVFEKFNGVVEIQLLSEILNKIILVLYPNKK